MPTQWLCVLMGGGTPDKHGALKGVFQLQFSGEVSYTVISCTQTVVAVYVRRVNQYGHRVDMCVVL